MQLQFVSILRSLSMLFVVSFHIYGFMYWGHFQDDITKKYSMTYEWVNQHTFINIAMPLFTLISGYLFVYIYNRGGYKSFVNLITSKMKRLIIPYIIFKTLMILTTGCEISLANLFMGPCFHLWYLSTLFWCFLLGWVLLKLCSKNYTVLYFLLLFLLISSSDSIYQVIYPILPMISTLRWFYWFILGMVISMYQEPFFGWIKNNKIGIPLLFPFIIMLIIAPVDYGNNFYTWYSVPSISCIMIAIMYYAVEKEQMLCRYLKPLLWLSQYSFGIYIFHYWIGPYFISSTAKRLFNLSHLADEHIVLFPFGFFCVTLLVSLFLTMMMKKIKLGRVLLG